MTGTAQTEGGKTMDIRDVSGLWCDDISFCPARCGWIDCPRNSQNIRDKTIPHSYFVDIPDDCPKKEEVMSNDRR